MLPPLALLRCFGDGHFEELGSHVYPSIHHGLARTPPYTADTTYNFHVSIQISSPWNCTLSATLHDWRSDPLHFCAIFTYISASKRYKHPAPPRTPGDQAP